MVAGLTWSSFLEWIVAGHAGSAGPQNRVENWFGSSVTIIKIFREKFTLNIDDDLAFTFLKRDFFGLDWGQGCGEQKK